LQPTAAFCNDREGRVAKPALTPIAYDDEPETLARGSDLYAKRCAMCHGGSANSGGAVADLRYSPEATYAIFDNIVRNGAFTGLGMPNLGSVVSESEAGDIRNYLLSLRAGLIEN
jgi:alcohol dehydrogenase (cytochrome c)/quinohemoprotein ethanol dehydrogenase